MEWRSVKKVGRGLDADYPFIRYQPNDIKKYIMAWHTSGRIGTKPITENEDGYFSRSENE